MDKIHIPDVDLNLLVVFDALIAEGQATRAAGRIGLTQSAVSHALKRLRVLFGDPLFIRSPRGMTPTPLAQDIAASVRSILEQVEAVLLDGRGFDPAASTRQFVIGLSDYAALVLLPHLSARLDCEAPGVSLAVRNTSHGVGLPMLDEGAVELIIGHFPQPPTHIREELLYEDDFVCACGHDQPDLGERLDVERYLSLRHLEVSAKGNASGSVDAVLNEQGLKRNIVLTVGHFLMVPILLDASDLVATEPRRLFDPLARRLQLRLFPPPLNVPSFRVVQAWHSRYDTDPAHRWLRGVVTTLANRLADPNPTK